MLRGQRRKENESAERGREGQIEEVTSGTFLVAQGLRLCAPNAGGPGSIPGQGTRSHMSQLKILCAVMKTEDSTCQN